MPVVLPSYLIRLYANSDLVLAQADGRLVLKWRDNADLTQRWNFISVSPEEHTYNILNVALLRGLSCQGYEDGLSLATEGLGDVWQIGGSGAFDEWNAIRLRRNIDWNLNVLGSGPYDVGRTVGVYKWDSDHANEMWLVAGADNTPQPTGVEKQLRARWPDGIIAVNATTEVIRYEVGGYTPFAPIRFRFDKAEWSLGFSLRNKFNHKYLKWGGVNQYLEQATVMSLDCLWTSAPAREAEHVAIRPWRDSAQNFTVDVGHGPDDPVFTLGWFNGLQQSWRFMPCQPIPS